MYKNESYYNGDGVEVMKRTVKLADRFHDEKGYLLYFNGRTVNGMAQLPFPSAMSKMDIANIAILSRHLLTNTNIIGYRSNRGYRAMDVKRIGENIGLSERQTYRFIKRMIEMGMIAKVTVEVEEIKQVQYVMNPLYFLNGRNVNDNLYWIFKDQIDEYLPSWAKVEYQARKGAIL